jgi:hypothetical protein
MLELKADVLPYAAGPTLGVKNVAIKKDLLATRPLFGGQVYKLNFTIGG